jgi:PKHD-type hydroxylase
MFLEIADVLSEQECQTLAAVASAARFVDGRISSPHSTVKNNRQIDPAGEPFAMSSKLMGTALQRNEAFRAFAYPRMMAPPLLAKYEPGMAYGFHTDTAHMEIAGRHLRTDVSCTLFLSDPSAYDGGELVVRMGTLEAAFKGKPGSAIVYPSNTLHQVNPVTRGVRLVGITFVQSMIRDPALRELLYDLDEVAALEGLTMQPENRVRLQHVRTSLQRIWSDAG